MQIKSIGIIGGTQGLGARFSEYFEQKFPEIEIFVSGRKTEITNKKIVQKCDVIIFAVPINKTVSVIEECVECSHENQVWIDFTSVKQQPVEAMLKSKAQVCGMHPVFGPMPEIEGQTLVYCPERINTRSLESVLALFKNFDCVKFAPKEHDDLMGIVQCASHFSDMVMGQTLKNSGFDFETIWKVSSPAYRLQLQVMGRIFTQNPELYADIAVYNLSSLKFLEKFVTAAEKLQAIVKEASTESIVSQMNESRDYLSKSFCQKSYTDSRVFLKQHTNKKVEKNTSLKNEKAEVAIFGDRFSHTDEATDLLVKSGQTKIYFEHIFQVVEAVESGLVECGILPYENSREGSVFQTLDELFEHQEVKIVSLVKKPITQNLLVLPGTTISQIKTIYSHPQALAQSKDFIHKNFTNISLKNEASTSAAGRFIKSQMDSSFAAIGSASLAKNLRLELLEAGIQGQKNKTSFIKIQKTKTVKDLDYTSFVIWFTGDKSGNLARVLTLLAKNNINLVKLDSRRAEKEYGSYLFFIDAKVSVSKVRTLFDKEKLLIGGIRILGSYK